MIKRLSLVLLAALAWIPSLFAQSDRAHAHLFTRAEGAGVKAVVRIEIEPGWHIYHETLGNGGGVGQETTLTFGGPGLEWSDTRFPKPIKLPQPGTKAPGG